MLFLPGHYTKLNCSENGHWPADISKSAIVIALLSYYTNTAKFCLGGEQGMLVNDQCSSW